VDFEWIKGVNCLSYQSWEGWLCLRWFWARKLEHTNWGRRGLLACRRWESGAPFIGQAGRPRPTGLGWFAPLARLFLPARSFLLHDFLARVLHELHRPNALVHSFSCIIGPSTWCFMLWVMSMLHLLHMSPWISSKVMLAAHPCLSFSCGLDESCWKGIQWCMHD
jgi:hypothetical protein